MMRDVVDAAAVAEAEISSVLDDCVKSQIKLVTKCADSDYQQLMFDIAIWVAMSRELKGNLEEHAGRQHKLALQLAVDATKGLKNLQKVTRRASNLHGLKIDLLIFQIFPEEMSEILQVWLENFERFESAFKGVETKRPAVSLRNHFLCIVALSWKDATGKVPAIDRRGPFLEYLELIRHIVPDDCRPRKFPSETVKKWLAKNRAMLERGQIEF